MMRTIRDYQEVYEAGRCVEEVLRGVWEAIRDEADEGIFISKMGWEGVVAQLAGMNRDGVLYGVPFVVKDNIDVAGLATTAGCPDYAYEPEESATVVRLLQEAGAVCFGKTNLDQFATGLVGVRTPYAVPRNVFDGDYLPGGSSSGSAVAVARGLVAFALGTDTAGSGRVPAAFNDLIGLKPSLGFLSTRGVVDACKSLDCVSVFTHRCEDADVVLRVAGRYDEGEAWSGRVPERWRRFPRRFKFGVPRREDLVFHGWDGAEGLFQGAVRKFLEMGGEAVEVDLSSFLEAARLLYEGPWVTERFVGVGDFLKANREAVLPVTRGIIEGGEGLLASDFFKARYRLAECRRRAEGEMEKVDFVVVPTVPRNFTIKEVAEEPVRLNSVLGVYTNFMNLLDYAAVALPAGLYEGRLPWGVTIFAGSGMDRALLEVGAMYEGAVGRQGAGGDFSEGFDEVVVVVCGAHMEGMGLNWQLRGRGAELLGAGVTADCYRMYVVEAGNGMPERPALVRVGDGEGVGIACEMWRMRRGEFGDFVAKIPGPLGMGKVVLEGGEVHCGFIAEAIAMVGARDVSEWGGWRGYVAGQGVI